MSALEATGSAEPVAKGADHRVIAYELLVAVPIIGTVAWAVAIDPHPFRSPMLLVWAAAIAAVDLMPVPASIDLKFSLSFPLQLAVALIYPVPVACVVALVGTSDVRELRRQVSAAKALFNRAQIAASVAAESALFHRVSTLHSPWPQLGATVLAATVVGYLVNVLLVAIDFHLQSAEGLLRILRQMHFGVFGEFVISYMGLALFGVLVATSFAKIGIGSIMVFVAPLAFARQMFVRTHSLKITTDELATKQKEQEWQVHHDSLTGLPNRVLFMERLSEAVEDAARTGATVAVLLMDLNDFKEVNDTLGHHFGDLLLEQIGRRLEAVVREGDLVARLGGDEFGVVLPTVSTDSVAIAIAERLLAALEAPLDLEGLAIDATASTGIALYPTHSDDVETLLRRADVAMYAAKESRGAFELYSSSRDRHSPARLTLISQIRPALERSEFVVHYQPKVDLRTNEVYGVEALLRWQHPERGLIPPDEFIPLVERTVMVRPVTHYVLNEALCQWHRWARAGLDLTIAVNLSARNLLDVELPVHVESLLDRWGIPPDRLILELTESSLMADSTRSVAVLRRLSGLGVSLSVDDFGTGYSSLMHLKRLPINEIKVDRSFVGNMLEDPNDGMIVRATVDLGRNLGLMVVAEGVEDQATWDALAKTGCHLAQGYYLTRPLPEPEMTEWLQGHPLVKLDRRLRTWIRPARVAPIDPATVAAPAG